MSIVHNYGTEVIFNLLTGQATTLLAEVALKPPKLPKVHQPLKGSNARFLSLAKAQMVIYYSLRTAISWVTGLRLF
jgi:hypothetical protein